MFYEFDLFNPRFDAPWKRSTDGVYDGTFEGDANYLSEVTQLLDPDASLVVETILDDSATMSTQMKAVTTTDSMLSVEKRNILPDG
jgi:hypothetical protein